MIQTWQFSPLESCEVFPASLWNAIPDPCPKTLWVKGTSRGLSLLSKLPDEGIAVVGTRNPQPRSTLLLQKVIQDIARSRPLIIISGLARGTDSAAHETALNCGLPTIAVLGSGIDQPYPSGRENLMRQILKSDGLIVSEYPPPSAARPWQFVERNRIIAGWSAATWVVEAGNKSGALHTASRTLEMGRPLFATPAFPGDPWYAGNLKLLTQSDPSARPLTSASDLGAQWIALATASAGHYTAPAQAHLGLFTPAALLLRKVQELQGERGGAAVSSLLDWALLEGWSPGLFFETLRKAIESGQVLDAQGLLMIRP